MADPPRIGGLHEFIVTNGPTVPLLAPPRADDYATEVEHKKAIDEWWASTHLWQGTDTRG